MTNNKIEDAKDLLLTLSNCIENNMPNDSGSLRIEISKDNCIDIINAIHFLIDLNEHLSDCYFGGN